MVYMDYAAAEPVCEKAQDYVVQALARFYNPSSAYDPSQYNRLVMENVREKIAKQINCKPEEIIFTSGASESNSLGVDGLLRANPDMIAYSTPIEHASIVDNPHVRPYLDVDSQGFVDLDKLERMVKGSPRKQLYVVGHANNVIGTIQDIEKIGSIIGEDGYFFVDAAQTFMKLPIDVQKMNIDLLSVSAGKFGGIRGTGFLYVREGIDLLPLIYGTQEENKRGGTYFDLGIGAMGAAMEQFPSQERTRLLRDYFLGELLQIPNVELVGPDLAHIDSRLFNNIYIKINGLSIDSQTLVGLLEEEGFLVSADSACHAGEKIFSHVLKALGETPETASTCCRITIGQDTRVMECIDFINALQRIIDLWSGYAE